MARETRDQLAARADRATKKETVLLMALGDALDQSWDRAESVEPVGDGFRWDLYLSRATGPHGGIVTIVWNHSGQRPSVEVNYLEDMRDQPERFPFEVRCVLERFRSAVAQLCQIAYART